MGLQKQNPAGANGEACESTHLARRVAQQDTLARAHGQYRLIATVPKNAREEFRISVRDFHGVAKIEVRVFEVSHAGIWNPTPRHLVLGRRAIADIISALCEAEARL